jgi:hypothetical protein
MMKNSGLKAITNFLMLGLTVGSSGNLNSQQEKIPVKSPNILFISTDDLRPADNDSRTWFFLMHGSVTLNFRY